MSSVSCEYVTGKKRCREEEGSFQAPTKKNRHEPSDLNGVAQPAGAAKKKKKHKAKKKKREEQRVESGDAFKAAAPAKESLFSKPQTDQSSKKASASSALTNGKAISSGTRDKSSGSSDGCEEVTQKPALSKSKHAQVAASKRPAMRKSSSSNSSSSEDEVAMNKSPKLNTSLKTCSSAKTPKEQASSVVPKSATSSTSAKKPQTRSSSGSSSSEDDESAAARKENVPVPKAPPQTKTASSSTKDVNSGKGSVSVKAGKISASRNPPRNVRTSKTQTSSDSSSSPEDEAHRAKVPATPKPLKAAQAQTQPCSDSGSVVANAATLTPCTPVGTKLQDNEDKAESSDSCSSSDMELVIRKPNPQLMAGLTPRGRARGFPERVKGRGGVRGGFGRARGTPWKQNFNYKYDTEEQRKQKEVQTNKSLVLQVSCGRMYKTMSTDIF